MQQDLNEFMAEILERAAQLKKDVDAYEGVKHVDVAHDTTEHEVVINGVLCDYCGEKSASEEVHTSTGYDQAICEGCWDHFN